jgi:hypothetical protein
MPVCCNVPTDVDLIEYEAEYEYALGNDVMTATDYELGP